MFIVTWLFGKLGYMPKIDMQVGKVNLDVKSPEFGAWPFPIVSDDFEPRPKPVVKKKPATKKVIVAKKPKVVAKTARTKSK
jgi:hypothetical protein